MLTCICPCVDILNPFLLIREFKDKSFTNETESTLLSISLDHLFCNRLGWARSCSCCLAKRESCWAVRMGSLVFSKTEAANALALVLSKAATERPLTCRVPVTTANLVLCPSPQQTVLCQLCLNKAVYIKFCPISVAWD